MNTTLLWLDFEATGLDTSLDSPIEVGAILTTTDLRRISGFSSVIRPPDAARERLMANAYVRDMHRANGLLDLIDDAPPLDYVEKELLAWIDLFCAQHPLIPGTNITLAGSGVAHFDLPLIKQQMPALAERLNYFVIDVGIIRRATEMWTGSIPSNVNELKTHRAMDDIVCHLAEAHAFRDLWLQRAD